MTSGARLLRRLSPGHCGEHCRHGDFVHCADQSQTGGDVDGGYVRASGHARVPEILSSVDAALGPRLRHAHASAAALTGSSIENEDSLAFAHVRGIHPITEVPSFGGPPRHSNACSPARHVSESCSNWGVSTDLSEIEPS